MSGGRDNLKPPRSTEEARERGKRGGVASGKSRKQRASMREALNVLLAAPVKNKELKEELKTAGAAELNTNSLFALRLLQQSLDGDTQAARLLLQAVGEHDPAAHEIATMKIDIAQLRLELAANLIKDEIVSNSNLIEALNANTADCFPDADFFPQSNIDRKEDNENE